MTSKTERHWYLKRPTTAFFIFLMRWDGEMDSLKWENPLGLVALIYEK
jgi:hypothetical protein